MNIEAPGSQRKNQDGRSACDLAYAAIRERILGLKLAPGEMISELILSRELSISRTPIREAMKRLEQEGLIVASNRRKRVVILSVSELEDIFDLKCAIEGYIAFLAAARKDGDTEGRLRGVLERMRSFAASLGPIGEGAERDRVLAEWLALDEEYHEILFAMAGNVKAREVVKNLNQQWHRWRMGINAIEGRIEKSVGEHLGIGQLVLAGDGPGAREAMVAHLNALKRNIVSIMSLLRMPGA